MNPSAFYRKKLTKRILIESIRDFYAKRHKVPIGRDCRNSYGLFSRSSYERAFGTFNNAVEAAGFIPNSARYINRKFTDEELVSKLRDYAVHLGRVPTARDLCLHKKEGMPDSRVYCRRFGSFYTALKMSGIPFNRFRYFLDYVISQAHRYLSWLSTIFKEDVRSV